MKHLKYIPALLAMLALAAISTQAMAEGELSGYVTGGLQYFAGDEDNAKFNEYRYRQDSEWGGFAGSGLLFLGEDRRISLDLHYLSPQDVDFEIKSLHYGVYKANLYYQRFGHNFAFDSKSVYVGDGTGFLTIPGATRAVLGVAPTATSLQNAVNISHTIDMYLSRDRAGTELVVTKFDPVDITANFDYEHREGTRPYGGTFGFGNAIEIPEPIKYDTYDAGIKAEYTGEPLYASASYYHSSFDNAYQSVSYENIFQNSPILFGRNALYPSNTFDSVSVVLAKDLPLDSRLLFDFNYGWARQDENLLPATINSGFAPFDSTAALPRDTAKAAVDVSNYDVKFSSRPIEKLEVKAGFRYYQHRDNTVEDPFPFIPYDDDVATETNSPENPSWISRTADAEVSYEVLDRTYAGAGYEYESETYRFGSTPKAIQNTFKVFADSHALDWMTGRVSFEYSNKNTNYPDYMEEDAELPWMRKYYATERDRYRAQVMSTIMPMDDLSMTLEYIFDYNDYSNSLFGLRDGRDHIATLDADYNITDGVSVYSFFSYENHRTHQRSRQWSPGAVSDPYNNVPPGPIDTAFNWDVSLNDDVYTAGLGTQAEVLPDKLTLNVDGLYTVVNGEADFGGNEENFGLNGPEDFNNVDETELWRASARLGYKLTKALTLKLCYAYEAWSIDDYTRDGVTEVKLNAAGTAYNGLLTMNSLYKDYIVHTITLGATYTF